MFRDCVEELTRELNDEASNGCASKRAPQVSSAATEVRYLGTTPPRVDGGDRDGPRNLDFWGGSPHFVLEAAISFAARRRGSDGPAPQDEGDGLEPRPVAPPQVEIERNRERRIAICDSGPIRGSHGGG